MDDIFISNFEETLTLAWIDPKAFDRVPQERVIRPEMLEAHSRGGDVFRWIKEWVKDSKQRLCINGLRQDSVLRPLLFIIYLFDLGSDVPT